MPNVLPYVKKHFKIHKSAINQNKSQVTDPDYFRPYGIQAFYGEQGSGKTITAIHFYQKISKRYPKAIIVSNIVLNDRQPLTFNENENILQSIINQGINTETQYIFYQSLKDYELVNRYIQNGKFGVILITDEYQNYFSNQDSRNVPPWVIEQAAQNRKQARLHIVTSQDYDQIVKPTRRRSDTAFKCRTYSLPFGLSYGPIFTVYWAYNAKKLDFDSNGAQNAVKPLKFGFYFHSEKLRSSFDTRQVVFTGSGLNEQFNGSSSFHVQNNVRVSLRQPKIKR